MQTVNLKIDTTELDTWITYLRDHGRKETTLKTYRNNVRQCLAYLMTDGRPYKAEDITVDDIHYLWRTLGAKDTIRMQYLRSLADMIIHYTGRDVVKQADILFNRSVRNRVFISAADFRTLYDIANPTQRLIMSLGAFMGLRRVEMHAIRDSDIKGDMVTIHGKGHGEQGLVVMVRIPEPVQKAISDYRRWKARLGAEIVDDFLFQRIGRDGKLHHMNISKISDAITDLRKTSGINVTTHSFRRFFATTLFYETDCDVQTLKKMMRHADISTTMNCYIDAYDAREREASDRLTGFIQGLVAETN